MVWKLAEGTARTSSDAVVVGVEYRDKSGRELRLTSFLDRHQGPREHAAQLRRLADQIQHFCGAEA